MAKKPIRVYRANESQQQPATRTQKHGSKNPAARKSHGITQEVLSHPEAYIQRKNIDKADKYKALLHCIYDAVFITDDGGKIAEVNARAEHIFNFSAEDMQRMNITDIIAGADKSLLAALNENVSEQQYTVLEAVCVRSNETRFDAEIVVNQITIFSARSLCFFIRDISERKEAEAMLQEANEKAIEAEGLQSRIDTLATLHHELNNPMQIMMCMAEIDNNPEYRKQLARIMAVLEQLRSDTPLNQVIDDSGVLRYEIAETTVLEECDPQRLLIVDDEEMLRKMFELSIAQAMPYLKIDSAANGEDALELFAKHHHSSVIMDIALPGMSGEECYQHINSFSQSNAWVAPRFVFCTGYLVPDSLASIIGDGSVHTCLKKPLTMSDLIDSVKGSLAGMAL